MRIRDWSSDVCSSDLIETPAGPGTGQHSTANFSLMEGAMGMRAAGGNGDGRPLYKQHQHLLAVHRGAQRLARSQLRHCPDLLHPFCHSRHALSQFRQAYAIVLATVRSSSAIEGPFVPRPEEPTYE